MSAFGAINSYALHVCGGIDTGLTFVVPVSSRSLLIRKDQEHWPSSGETHPGIIFGTVDDFLATQGNENCCLFCLRKDYTRVLVRDHERVGYW